MSKKIMLSRQTALAILGLLQAEKSKKREEYFGAFDGGNPYVKEYESMMNRAEAICNEFEVAMEAEV